MVKHVCLFYIIIHIIMKISITKLENAFSNVGVKRSGSKQGCGSVWTKAVWTKAVWTKAVWTKAVWTWAVWTNAISSGVIS